MMEKFHHTLPDGHQLTLPKFEHLSAGLIRKTRRMEQVDQVFTVLEELLSEADLAHVDALSKSEFNEFVQLWQKDSGIQLGESSASTTS